MFNRYTKLTGKAFFVGLGITLSACVNAPPPGSPAAAVPTPPARVTVSNPVAGLAQMATADVQAGINELVAAGANTSTAPLPLQDSYTCGVWLLNTAIPAAQQLVQGIVPSGTNVAGPYSAFIAAKIAVYNVTTAVGSAQQNLIDQVNHNCGAAIAGDVNGITVLLAKAGIAVSTGGILSGALPAL
jgi:hypothetical protein